MRLNDLLMYAKQQTTTTHAHMETVWTPKFVKNNETEQCLNTSLTLLSADLNRKHTINFYIKCAKQNSTIVLVKQL